MTTSIVRFMLVTTLALATCSRTATARRIEAESWREVETSVGRSVRGDELRRAWKAAGKPVHCEPARDEPHALLGPWRGELKTTRVDFDVPFVDGQEVRGGPTVRVAPGRHELAVRWDAAKQEVHVVTLETEAGMEYRLFPRLRGKTPRAGWHVVVRARRASAR